MTKINVEKVAEIISEVADAEILPRFRRLKVGDIAFKTGDDPVTIADKEAEKALSIRFLDLLPGSKVVGEEAFATNPRLLECFFGESPVWIVDPIDGTRNFVAGNPTFGVIVGLAERNQMVAGWPYDPMSKEFIAAEIGSGAYIYGVDEEKKSKHKAPNSPPNLADNAGFLTHSTPKKKNSSPLKLKILPLTTNTIPRGTPGWRISDAYKKAGKPNLKLTPQVEKTMMSACHEYARLVTGEPYFSLPGEQWHFRMILKTCSPWDDAAGFLIHQEAGGYGALWDDSPLLPSSHGKGFLLAPDHDSWLQLREWVRTLVDLDNLYAIP